jgi:cytidyltransferase-like protein
LPRKVGCIVGVFDLFHIGHLDQLQAAAGSCERLVVALASDDVIEARSGSRPFVPEVERAEIVAAVKAVHTVVTVDTLELADVVQELQGAHDLDPHLVFVPEDADDAGVTAEEVEQSLNGSTVGVVRLPSNRTTRSSAVAAALRERSEGRRSGRSNVA